MTTLEVETECRGTLIATLQPIQEDGDAYTIAGHIVPKDKSTGKVFFNFMLDDEKYECELLPKKGLHAYNKLTDVRDEDIMAEICDNLKETIYDAKQEELNSMRGEDEAEKVKTPVRSRKVSRNSTDAKSSEKPKSRATAKITETGKMGQECSGLELSIYALKRKKRKAMENTSSFDDDTKDYVKALKDYSKTREGKSLSGDINTMLSTVEDIANLREEWSGKTHAMNKINPKSKKMEGYDQPILKVYADLLRATAKHIETKIMDVEAIEEELKEKMQEFAKKSRMKTDLKLLKMQEDEDFGIDDLDGVDLIEMTSS